MPTFALKQIRDIGKNGLFDFHELVVDGVRPLKEFYDSVKHDPKLYDEIWGIYENFDLHARGAHLPYSEAHQLEDSDQGGVEWEFKSKHIRVFCFKASQGKIIVMAEFKEPKRKNQENQLRRFRNLKRDYLASLKS